MSNEKFPHLIMEENKKDKKYVQLEKLDDIIKARDKNLVGVTNLNKYGTLGILPTIQKMTERNLTDDC